MTWRPTTLPWEAYSPEEQELLRVAWASGQLTYKLDASQLEVFEQMTQALRNETRSSADRYFVLDISRQWGKDFCMAVLALILLITRPGIRVPYGAMSRESLKEILIPTFNHVLQDCPPEMRPEELAVGKYRFPNGSVLRMVGVNQDPDALRGAATEWVFLTEVGFYREPEYVLNQVVLPMLMTKPDGFTIMGSTPARTPAHYWSRVIVPTAKAEGKHAHRTIDDNPRLSEAQRQGFIRRFGGRESTKCRRELFAEHVTEETLALVPEWVARKGTLVKEVDPPPFRRCVVAMDTGFSDLTVALLAYYHWNLAAIVVEDEVVLQRASSGVIDARVAEAELERWGEDPESGGVRNVLRVADASKITVADLSSNDRGWISARKDDAEAAHNALREWVRRERFIVHPRCKVLLSHLEHGVWRTDSKGYPTGDYDRSGDFGHFDAVAAAKYLVRHIDEHTNPYPASYGLDRQRQLVRTRAAQSGTRATIKKVFGG